MAVTRRTVLAGAGLAGTALAFPALAHVKAKPALAVYDSRLPQAAEFVRECKVADIKLFDIAPEDANLWRASRNGFGTAPGAEIIGLTAWSDWVMLRGALHAKGLRVASERRVERGGRSLFAWSVA